MAYIIGFISQKGGVGKSTLARATAQEFKKNGFRVKLVDLDVQQGTTVDWHRRRLENGQPSVGSVECFRSAKEALAESQGYDAIVIDGAGRSSDTTKAIATLSDIVIQPTAPTLDDLVPTIRLNNELVQKGISRKKIYIALTLVCTEAEERSAREYIAQTGYNVLDGATYMKPAYRMALNAGQTITETRYGSLNAKVDVLMQSIFDKLTQ